MQSEKVLKADTSMLDVYEAMGLKVEDGMVLMPEHFKPQPFDIRLRVIPVTHTMDSDEGAKITFSIVLKDTLIPLPWGGVRQIYYEEQLTLPLGQIDIIKKEKTDEQE